MATSDVATIDQQLDLASESADQLVTVVFPRSPSKNFPMALSIAQQGKFKQATIGKQQLHVASFSKDERGAKLATALLDLVGTWKSVVVYASGQLIKRWYDLNDVLSCYLESCLCTDFRAHCFRIMDDPAFVEPSTFGLSISIREGPANIKYEIVDRYSFPCSKIFTSTRIDPEHPSGFRDQIQAAAVKKLCHLCPRFDPGNFRKIGTKTYGIEVD